jgi:RNA polymerase sporulation-specific sigma factor
LEIEVIDDPDTIRKAKMGDQDALTKIIEGSRSLVRSFVRKYRRKHLPYEDMEQEGFIGVWRALKTYDFNIASFYTYSCLWIRQRMLRQVRKKTVDFLSFDEKRDNFVFNSELEDLKEEVEKSLKCLDVRPRMIVEQRYGIGCPPKLQRELAEELNISTQRVDAIEKSALIKMKRNKNDF